MLNYRSSTPFIPTNVIMIKEKETQLRQYVDFFTYTIKKQMKMKYSNLTAKVQRFIYYCKENQFLMRKSFSEYTLILYHNKVSL